MTPKEYLDRIQERLDNRARVSHYNNETERWEEYINPEVEEIQSLVNFAREVIEQGEIWEQEETYPYGPSYSDAAYVTGFDSARNNDGEQIIAIAENHFKD